MGVILLGDKTAAAHWLSYAKSRAAALAKQGKNLSQTFSPAEGVTIRVQTLQGNPRVWIEAGGADYVCVFGLNEDGTSANLWTGLLRSGVAKRRGKSLFAGFPAQETNLTPLGGGVFLAGPPAAGIIGSFVQYITADGGIPKGSAFNPWQETEFVGVKGVCYSGLRQDGVDGPISRRFHVLYRGKLRFDAYPFFPLAPEKNKYRMPVAATTYDGGQSFQVSTFVVPLTATYTTIFAETLSIQAEISSEAMIFCGNSTVAIISSTTYASYNVEEGTFNDPGQPDGNFQDAQVKLVGIHTLLSIDGGQAWSSHHTTYESLGLAYPNDPYNTVVMTAGFVQTACYIGGSSLIAMPSAETAVIDGNYKTTVFKSNDYGQTFFVIQEDTGMMPPMAGGLAPICEGAAAYINVDFRGPHYGKQVFFRTVDGGVTWTATPLPSFAGTVLAGNIVLRERLSPPAELPEGKVPADYAKFAVIWRLSGDDGLSYQIGLSDDGGATWRAGGLVSSSESGYNVGIFKRPPPPFPGYPDLHKNGLPIP